MFQCEVVFLTESKVRRNTLQDFLFPVLLALITGSHFSQTQHILVERSLSYWHHIPITHNWFLFSSFILFIILAVFKCKECIVLQTCTYLLSVCNSYKTALITFALYSVHVLCITSNCYWWVSCWFGYKSIPSVILMSVVYPHISRLWNGALRRQI